MKEKIEKILDEIRPGIQADGGNVEFVSVNEDGVVTVKLTGACAGCLMSQMTLKMVIEKKIKDALPEIKQVVAA
jgi:Fe-S cluster biogenesis protein NfuA